MKNFQPQDCDTEVFDNGEFIGIIHTYPSPQVEAFVRYAAQLSGQRIDWHYSGGRGRVLVIGDTEAAIKAFHDLRLDPRCTDLVPAGKPRPSGMPYMDLGV